ncbi:MAG: hypothetical protein JWR01_1245 [Subtercola sp.]|nr:hypothetical protein [Subtercola sp.]
MTPTDETERGDWLRARIGGWGTVGGVAGTGFEAYVRLLHPAPIDGPGATASHWTWQDVATRTGGTVHPLAQWWSLAGPDDRVFADPGGPVRLSSPPAGRLHPGLLAVLVPALTEATTRTDDLTLAVWNGWGQSGLDAGETLHLPGRDYALRTGSLFELSDPLWPWSAGIGWNEPFEGPMPQLIWPADHAWVVASEIDWDSTIVAGSRALIDELLSTPAVETLEIDPAGSLTSDSDLVNTPPR